MRALPRQGAAPNDVKRQLMYKQGEDTKFADGDSRVSGAPPVLLCLFCPAMPAWFRVG